MNSRIPYTCVVFGLVLVALMSGNPSAEPKFSAWSIPVNLGPTINSAWRDIGPALSKDGLSLYFSSDRPGGFGNQDIWVSERASIEAPWALPWNLGTVINSTGLDAVPSLSRDGHWLFFNSDRGGGLGQLDVWASYRAHIHDNFAWGPPINVGAPVNTAFIDAGVWTVENDEGGSPLLFFVSTRPGGLGNFDIYVSTITAQGSLGPPELVSELNSTGNDRRPSVRFDGLEVFLDSDRAGSLGADLWAATRESVSQPWSAPINLGIPVNSTATDLMPYIAADREMLFFTSDRPGGSGDFDLYVTKRNKVHGR